MSDVSLNALHKEKPVPLWPNDGSEAFDYDEVERRLAADSGTISRDEVETAVALGAVLSWLSSPSYKSRRHRPLHVIGLRVVALAWLIETRGIGSESANSLAVKLGVTPQLLHRYIAEASKRFKLRNRFQAHGRMHSQN